VFRSLIAGDFNLEIGFTDRQIRRNLLGRDFFNLVQIGFREHQLQYYLNTTPSALAALPKPFHVRCNVLQPQFSLAFECPRE
jgi:hypothetical protein